MIGFFVGFINTIFVSKLFTYKYLDGNKVTPKYIGMTLLITLPLNFITLLLIAYIRGSL